jgi:hypothetical protein
MVTRLYNLSNFFLKIKNATKFKSKFNWDKKIQKFPPIFNDFFQKRNIVTEYSYIIIIIWISERFHTQENTVSNNSIMSYDSLKL